METLSRKEITAKKPHQCNWCLCEIQTGKKYERSVHVYDGIYTWKNHVHCRDIAEELRMFDWVDEGVTEENFNETIREEYRRIWREKDNDHYESKDFSYPNFSEQLDFVLAHHNIKKD